MTRLIRSWTILATVALVTGCASTPTPRPHGSPTAAPTASPSATPVPSPSYIKAPISTPAPTSSPSSGWRLLPKQPELGPANLLDLTAFHGSLVAVGTSVNEEPGVIWSSPDGLTWRSIAGRAQLAHARLAAVAAGKPGLVAVGSGYNSGRGIVLFSPDGVSWSSRRLPNSSAFSATSVAWGLGRFVAVGTANSEYPSIPTIVWHSVDGRTWSRATIVGASHAGLFGVTAGPRGFVAVGSIRDRAAAWVSSDGRSWRSTKLPGGPSGVESGRVRYVGGRFLLSVMAFGPNVDATRGLVWSSPDGRTWTRSTVADSGAAVWDFAAIPGGIVLVGQSEQGDQPEVVAMADQAITGWTLQPADPVLADAWMHAVLPSPDGHRLIGVGESGSGGSILIYDLPILASP